MFNNAEVVNILKERGQAIKSQKWTKRDEINKTLTTYCKDNLSTITTPKEAFITFEKLSGFEQLVENKTKVLFGEETACYEATDPTNFIFEN